jgi:hypothetical protein
MFFSMQPPDGVMPRRTWERRSADMDPRARDDCRLQALLDAAVRYRAAGFEPLPQWQPEIRELLARALT